MEQEEKTVGERWVELDNYSKEYFIKEIMNTGEAFPPTGPFFVSYWSRDCDMCETSRVYKVDTYEELLENFIDYIDGLEWQEGPSSWSLVPEDEYWGDHVDTRDRVMEAYENGGNGYWV